MSNPVAAPTSQMVRLLGFWRTYTDANRFPPTYAEAMPPVGLRSTNSIRSLIARCVEFGLLARSSTRSLSRAISITDAGRRVAGGVPVIGESKCACGASFFLEGRKNCEQCKQTALFISPEQFKCSSVNNPDAVQIPLTLGFVAVVDVSDYELVSRYSWRARVTGSHVYATSRIGGATGVLMHRLLLGAAPGEVVDHISNNGLDNRRANIRIATHAENSHNMRSSANQKRGRFKGVTLCAKTQKWRAYIRVPQPNGPSRSKYLGRFTHPQEAALAYDAAARLHYGRFAACNYPDES